MDEVKDLLCAWGLAELSDTFNENAITIEALASLTLDAIRELIPKIGHRVIFTRCWRDWLLQYTGNVQRNSLDILDFDISSSAIEVFQDAANSESCTLEKTEVVYDLLPVHQVESMSTSHSVQVDRKNGVLNALLEKNLDTKGLLAYAGHNLPGDSERNLLAAVIAKKILHENKNTPIRGEIYYKWCALVKELFPEERTTTYYIPACRTASGTTIQARGKLLNQIYNIRKRLQKQGVLSVNSKKSRESSPASSVSCSSPKPLPEISDEIDIAIENDLEWLQQSCDPWYLVEEKWKSTFQYRTKKQNSIKGSTIEQYIKDFPALKTTFGYSLLEYDFSLMHPDNSENLFINFPLFKGNILKLLKQRKTKDQFVKEIAELANGPDEEVLNTVALIAIPLMLRSTVSHPDKKKTNKGCWKPSKAEALAAFITHVRSNTEIKEAVEKRRQKLIEKGFSPQPFCVVVGHSLTELTTFLVVVNTDAMYERKNILAAVDTCFKCIWSLNAEYSFDSYATWYFIQRGFYKLTSQFDKGSTAAESLLSDCKITS